MSEEQLGALALFLKNRVSAVLPRDAELRLSVNGAIDTGLEDFFDSQRLEVYKGVDVEKLVDDFSHYLEALKDLATELQAQLSKNGGMVESGEVTKPLIVRSQGRITLRMFDEGTVLRCRILRKQDGTLGGVELLIQ